jgi:transposase
MKGHYIGLDAHAQSTEIAVVTGTGRVVKRDHVPTTIPKIVEVLEKVPKPRFIAIEESSLADWLWRNLREHGDEMTVCEPRRNHLIAKDSDKDDPIDAEKLAQLLRGGFIKPVHHPDSQDRIIFKQHVGLYDDQVRERVRLGNRIVGCLRRYGIVVRAKDFATGEQRIELLKRLPASKVVSCNVRLLWRQYDRSMADEATLRRRLVTLARKEEVIRRFTAVPGIMWVRAATFFVHVDTPWRFKSKSALNKYLGLGLERRQSGQGSTHLRLVRQANRRVKKILLGAARSAVCSGDNPFSDQYRRWIEKGTSSRLALRNTARSLAATLWGMWKNGNAYHPEWVGAKTVQDKTSASALASGCT